MFSLFKRKQPDAEDVLTAEQKERAEFLLTTLLEAKNKFIEKHCEITDKTQFMPRVIFDNAVVRYLFSHGLRDMYIEYNGGTFPHYTKNFSETYGGKITKYLPKTLMPEKIEFVGDYIIGIQLKSWP
jgi:hypothetical protein